MAKVKEKMRMGAVKKITLIVAIANKMIDELGLTRIINERVEWDETHWRVSPGGLAKALVLSTFTDMRAPLTHIQDRLYDFDLSYLIGPEAGPHGANSFNVGRALERIGESDCSGMYETMALTALTEYEMPVTRMNSDTTTVSFYGEYDMEKMNLTAEEKEEILRIEKGYNKDGRPKCKQILVGQVTNEHGLPLISRAMGGATSDVEWNSKALDHLDEMQEKGFKSGIYVADCKLVTEGLISRMHGSENRVQFVSRCPASFENKLESRTIERAYASGGWEDVGQVGGGKHASAYRCVSFIETVCGSPARLLVAESSALAKKAWQSLDKERAKLGPLISCLEKKKFACRADAEKEYARFLAQKEMKLFGCAEEITETIEQKWPRGRRGKDTRPAIVPTYQVRIKEVGRDPEACRQYLQNKSCLVIISNVIDESVTNRELLETYKGQHVVENSFRQLKSPNLASVIYLKNPKRIGALTMLLTFSLLIRALIQYRLRDGLQKHAEQNPGVPIYAGWGGRELKNPTFKLLYEHSANCYYEREGRGEYLFEWPFSETRMYVEPLLALMGISVKTLLL